MPRRPAAAGPPTGGDLRERLLDAAAVEVAAGGTDALSLRALARTVGVSHQAPLHVFGSRRGLLTALAAAATERLAENTALAAAAATTEHAAGPDVVLAIGIAYVELARSEPALFTLATNGDVLDLADPDLRAARVRAWAVLHDAVAAAQDNGWRTGQPTELVALLCWSVVQGVAVIYRDALAPEGLSIGSPEAVMLALRELL